MEYASVIRLDTPSRILTIVLTIVFSVVCLCPVWLPLSTLWLTLSGLVCLAAGFVKAPLRVLATGDSLVIKLVTGAKKIPYGKIRKIDLFPCPDLSWRVMGSGGFMGYYGVFRSRALGRFHAYVGTPRDSILVELKDGGYMVFSCADPDAMVSAVRSHLD